MASPSKVPRSPPTESVSVNPTASTAAAAAAASSNSSSSSSPLSFKMKVTRSGGVCSKTGGGTSDPYSPGNGESDNELDAACFSDGEGESIVVGGPAIGAPPPPVVTVAPSPADAASVGCGPFQRGGVDDAASSDFDEVDSSIGCFGQISKRQSQSTAAISTTKSETTASAIAASKLTKSMTLAGEQSTADDDDLFQSNNNNNNKAMSTSLREDKAAVAKEMRVTKDDGDLLVQASLRALAEKEAKSVVVVNGGETIQASLAKSSVATASKVETVTDSVAQSTEQTTSSSSSSSAFTSSASEQSTAVAKTIESSKVQSSVKECTSKVETQSTSLSSSTSSSFSATTAETTRAMTSAEKTTSTVAAIQQQQQQQLSTSSAKSVQQTSVSSSSQQSSVSSSSTSTSQRVVKASGTLRQASMGGQLNLLTANRGSPLKITLNSRCISEDGEGDDSFDALVEKFSTTIKIGVTVLRDGDYNSQRRALSDMHKAMRSAWATPMHGRDVAMVLCDLLRDSGGLGILISKVEDKRKDMRLDSAKVIEQSLTANNRDFVVKEGLNPVVNFSIMRGDVHVSRVGTGILGNLFKHSEDACHKVIKLGGLDSIVDRCITADKDTNRQCAIAFANLAMYGGVENQQRMIKKQVPAWLFPLAFSTDDITKYYACLAICTLASNKEFAATVEKSGTLALVEPFITQHDPGEFAASDGVHQHGQSEGWLRRLLPLLDSTNKEAQSLASFHFAMEATIKSKSSKHQVLKKIGAIAALQKVASCPNDSASKLAASALRTLGEDIPHHLSQQVPLWTVNDVFTWVDRVAEFPDYAQAFLACRIDGDLLLQITEEQLRDDVEMTNGLHRKRFLKYLTKLKQECDYSSVDHSKLDHWLLRVGAIMTQYTYDFCRNGVYQSELGLLEDEHLQHDIGITNGIHRKMLLQAIREKECNTLAEERGDSESGQRFVKNIDVFISYRRSNGSQLASLLKVHLQLRGFTVFIDIEKLEAGKFDENLLNSVRAAKHFLLVLTPKALDRCIGDDEQNDWVHKEIATALQSDCNIIPITDDFDWPQPESLPEDIRKVCYYNGVRWIHDYQDACVEKIVRFIRGEIAASSASQYSRLNSQPQLAGGSLAGSNASGSDYQPSAASFKDSKAKWKSIDSNDDTLDEEETPEDDVDVDDDDGQKRVGAAAIEDLEVGAEEAIVDEVEEAKGKSVNEDADGRGVVNGETTTTATATTDSDVVSGVPNGDLLRKEGAGESGEEEEAVSDLSSIVDNADDQGPLVIKENGWERGDAGSKAPSTNGASVEGDDDDDEEEEEEEEEEEMEEVEERSTPFTHPVVYGKAPTVSPGATLNGRSHESSASEDEIDAPESIDAAAAATKTTRKEAVESSA